jgi:hypothetical protein
VLLPSPSSCLRWDVLFAEWTIWGAWGDLNANRRTGVLAAFVSIDISWRARSFLVFIAKRCGKDSKNEISKNIHIVPYMCLINNV